MYKEDHRIMGMMYVFDIAGQYFSIHSILSFGLLSLFSYCLLEMCDAICHLNTYIQLYTLFKTFPTGTTPGSHVTLVWVNKNNNNQLFDYNEGTRQLKHR